MFARKIVQNQYNLPRNKSVLNEQILINEKLQLEKKINNNNVENGLEERNDFFPEKLVQDNAINEEDGYNSEVYNNSITKDDNFLIKNNNIHKNKTIPICQYFNEISNKNKKINFNCLKKLDNNKYDQNYCSNSIDMINNLNLNIEENDKNIDENLYFLLNNINIFKILHNERKKNKIINRILLKETKSEKNILKPKEKDGCITTNKFSKKYKKKLSQNIDNGIVKRHSKMASLAFNESLLTKNKITLVNPVKSSNKSISKSKSNYLININDDNFNTYNIDNITKIKPETKNLYTRYAKNNITKANTKLDITNDENNKINKKNTKIRINVNNSYYDAKKKYLEKGNGCNLENDNSNYIFNLKFYHICNNNNQDDIIKKKSKSNSMLNDYIGKERERETENNNEEKIIRDIIPKKNKNNKNVFKKKVVFEEEYLIDSNGNQKFLCVKRIADTNGNNESNEQRKNNSNKRNYTTNNLLSPEKNGNTQKIIDYNSKNNKLINGKLMRLKKKEKKLETKTVFISPQMSYQNVVHQNSLFVKSHTTNSDKKEIKNQSFMPKNNNPKKNNIKIMKELNDLNNNKSYVFKNNLFYNCNSNNTGNNIYIIYKTNDNIENSGKIKHNKINRIQIINKENPLNIKNQMKKKIEEKSQTLKNSRNYISSSYINIDNYNNKDNYNIKSDINEKKSVNKFTYTTTNYDNNKIIFPPLKFLNNSQRNYQFHEIRSTSRDKLPDVVTNSANKSQINNFYFESERYPKIVSCTSMDNIKKSIKDNNRYDEVSSLKDKFLNSSRFTNIYKMENPKYTLLCSQENKN